MTQNKDETDMIAELARLISVFNRLALSLVMGACFAVIAAVLIIVILSLTNF